MIRPGARPAALLILSRWGASPAPLAPIEEAVLAQADLNNRDRALALAMVRESLRRLQDLDSVIALASRHPLPRMRPLTLAALRLGLCQLLFFPAIPPAAAVNETVAAFKQAGQPRWLTAFVHGCLRTMARDLPGLRLRLQESGASTNHPSWLLERWQARMGDHAAAALCQANNSPPPLVVRVHGDRITADELLQRWHTAGLAARPCPLAENCLILPEGSGLPAQLPGHDAGTFHVQDEGAQLVCLLMGPFRSEGRYLDACAGLGGKTATLAQLLPPPATMTATEPEPRRFRLLEDNLTRLGLSVRVRCLPWRLEELAAARPPAFHGILLDVPCSGTGVIRRRPDIRWNRQPGDLLLLPRQQRELLETAAGLLAPGGILVYATCSMEPEENEDVIHDFLRHNPAFILDDAAPGLPAAARHLTCEDGFFRTSPLQGMDGFFAARLRLTTEI